MPRPRVLSIRALRRAAPPDVFERGEEYFTDGRVVQLVLDANGDSTAATVRGTVNYRVRVWRERGAILATCTCPFAEDRAFCKHAVAAGLAWLERAREGQVSGRVAANERGDDLAVTLARHSKETLAALLLEVATEDDDLHDRLLLRAAREGVPDVAAYKRAIRRAVATHGGIPYREAVDYAVRLEQVADALDELLERSHTAETIDLAEYFLASLERRIEDVDDSDGLVGGVLGRVQDLHLAACRKGRPDPVQLARRLFHWALISEYDVFTDAPGRYARVLGANGLAAYRAAAEEEWAKVPPLGPGDDPRERYSERFRITEVMKALARQARDTEALVAIHSRDLSSSYAFFEIADLLREARQPDRVLEWAERGVAAFPEADPRLREVLAEEYARRGRHDDAVRTMWAEFAERPYVEAYGKLKRHAARSGSWPEWRGRALALVRERSADARRSVRGTRSYERSDHSGLVRLLLWEGDLEAAWREARESGCSSDLWRELARRREREHPEDALTVYRSLLEPVLAAKSDIAYADATALLGKMRDLLRRLGRGGEFVAELAAVRAMHRRKRNFMRMLDAFD